MTLGDEIFYTQDAPDALDCFGTMPRQAEGQEQPYVRTRCPRLRHILTIRPKAEPHKVNTSIPEDPLRTVDLDHIPEYLGSSVDDLIAHLDRSVMLQTYNIPQRR